MQLFRVLNFKPCESFELQHSFCGMVKLRMYQLIYVLELGLSTKTYELRYLDYTFKRKQFALGGGHCVLKLKLIVYFDSLHGINRNLLRTILNYVKSQHVSYSTSIFEEKDWDISAPTDLNLQKNSYDCGVYVCMYSFMVCNGYFHDCNDLDSKSARNWIATNIISEPEEKLKHEKLDSKQRGSSFPTTKWSENFVVNRKSPRGFILSKNFVKDVSSSLFIGRYSLCALQSSYKKPSNKEMIFYNGDWYHKECLSI